MRSSQFFELIKVKQGVHHAEHLAEIRKKMSAGKREVKALMAKWAGFRDNLDHDETEKRGFTDLEQEKEAQSVKRKAAPTGRAKGYTS